MFVAIIVLMLNGQPIMEGHSEQHFLNNVTRGGCDDWLDAHVDALEKAISKRGLSFTIQARCDLLT